MKLAESIIIKRYLKTLSFNRKSSLKLEDDVYYDKNKKFIFSVDTYEENIHFLKGSKPKEFVSRILRATISDIICKGSTPEVYFLSLSLPKVTSNWLKSFKLNLLKESKRLNLFLGGGDTVKSKKLSISISVIGNVLKKPILRSTAKVNDDIYTTGSLGNSYLGLQIYKKKLTLGKDNFFFKKAYIEPYLPIKFSKHLSKFATSSTDISDGLIQDLKNICKASKCGGRIYLDKVPLSKKAMLHVKKKKINTINFFSRGDDYQILFTANKKSRKMIKNLSKSTSTKVTRIGKIVSEKLVKLTHNGKVVELHPNKSGYIHNF